MSLLVFIIFRMVSGKDWPLAGTASGGNASVQTTAFVGSYPLQNANGITFGDFSFRISRRSNAVTYTTSSEQLDAQIRYNGAAATATITGYASTMFAGGQYDYSNSTIAAPSSAPETEPAIIIF